LTFNVQTLEGDLNGGDGAASICIDIIGRPLTPLSYAGAARRSTFRGAIYARAAGAAAYGAAACLRSSALRPSGLRLLTNEIWKHQLPMFLLNEAADSRTLESDLK
jgi:hypothetical protein